ncbi:MAG: hypothetical protein V4599_07695 [Verrucomicrobiota bacterium]
MKKLLLTCLLGFITLPLLAESPYSIDLMGTGKAYLFHEGGWQRGAECIEAKVSTANLLKKDDMVIKAYFYGDSAEPMHVSERPTSVVLPNNSTLGIPMEIAKGKKHEFFFGIPSKIAQGGNKWRRVVVVFGDKSSVAARVYPKDDIASFNFPEKSLIKQ